MDADRFDAFVKALSLSAARRGMVAGLLGGSLATLLASFESEAKGDAHRRNGRHADLAVEKRKKHKKKHHKKHKKKGSPPPDQDPPCTENSCPLPPECSQQTFDDCTAAIIEALQADIEPCRPDCEDGDSPACEACLEPILTAHLPEASACVAESCSLPMPTSAMSRHQAKSQAGPAGTHARWQRRCDNSTCCTQDLETCYENSNGAFLKCMAPAIVTGCIIGGLPGCAAGMLFCLGNFAYDESACEGRYGCPSGQYCVEGNRCCPYGTRGCGSQCCSSDETCQDGECQPLVCGVGNDDTPCGEDCCKRFEEQCCHTGAEPHCCGAGEACCGDRCCGPDRTCTTGTYHGVPRSSCCGPPSDPKYTVIPCDGVCCETETGIVCCPGKSNPCTAPAIGCG